jgi:hypothetical protein
MLRPGAGIIKLNSEYLTSLSEGVTPMKGFDRVLRTVPEM